MPAFRSLTLRERADALAHRIGFERAQRAGIRTRLIALASVLPAMPKRPHVVVVPQEHAVEVANRSVDVAEREDRIREEIKRGATLSSVQELERWEQVR